MKNLVVILSVLIGSVSMADQSGEKVYKHHNQKAVKVEIGKKGFQSKQPLKFKAGELIVLDITRTTKKTCMTELKHPKTGKLVDLPLNKEVRFEVGSYDKSKKIDLLCGMDMKAGVIHVN